MEHEVLLLDDVQTWTSAAASWRGRSRERNERR